MADPETKSAIQADKAWGVFTRTLAHNVPGHLHNSYLAVRRMKRRRLGGVR